MNIEKPPFVYQEKLTAKEMAQMIFDEVWDEDDLKKSEVKSKIKWVRNQLQRLGYSHRQNKEKHNFERVKEYFAKHPTATPTQAAKALRLSRPSIYKFRAMGNTYVASESKTKFVSPPSRCLSIGDKLTTILRNIIQLHLDDAETFHCDLTFGEGGFYKKTDIKVPALRFDKFDFGENSPKFYEVKELTSDNLKGLKVSSVVIDLPVQIENDDASFNSFKSVAELYQAYDEYIGYACDILRKDGILVFSTADFILREGDDDDTPGVWATDYAIFTALSLGFDLKDKIHLVRKGGVLKVEEISVQSGVKDSTFLIFVKRR